MGFDGGGDQVVRLNAGLAQDRQAKGGDQRFQILQLGDQRRVRRRAVGLVIRKDFMPEGFAGAIQAHRAVRRLQIIHHLDQHLRKPVQRVGRQAIRPRQVAAHRVKGAEEKGHAVYEDKVGGHGGTLRERGIERKGGFGSGTDVFIPAFP